MTNKNKVRNLELRMHSLSADIEKTRAIQRVSNDLLTSLMKQYRQYNRQYISYKGFHYNPITHAEGASDSLHNYGISEGKQQRHNQQRPTRD